MNKSLHSYVYFFGYIALALGLWYYAYAQGRLSCNPNANVPKTDIVWQAILMAIGAGLILTALVKKR